MKPDPFRTRLRELLRRNDLTMKRASLAIGRNHSFLQQYLTREHPRVLRHGDSEALANLLGCEPGELRHPVVPPRRPAKRQRRRPPAGTPVAEIPELVGAAAAGCLARNEAVPRESPRWYLPDTMLRQEVRANPEDLRVVSVRGDAMEPLLSEGDRLVIDTARRCPHHRGTLRAMGRQRPGGQARGDRARNRARAVAAHDRQPELCTHHAPRRGGPHRRNGAVDIPAALTDCHLADHTGLNRTPLPAYPWTPRRRRDCVISSRNLATSG